MCHKIYFNIITSRSSDFRSHFTFNSTSVLAGNSDESSLANSGISHELLHAVRTPAKRNRDETECNLWLVVCITVTFR